MTTRPVYSRTDLPRLAAFDRQQVFAALGSFDEHGLTDDAFIVRALDLLDAGAVPGLAEARAAGDTGRALEAVYAACKQRETVPVRPELTASVRTVADEALTNRFTFYGEAHQLPATIDWDDNPGTAHWGHDLNRFSYLGPLTQAYQATGDTRYSRKAIELILAWIDQCDMARAFTGTPYAFGSYLNQAIHCTGWSTCVSRLLAFDQVTPLELLRILKSLHDQLAYLEIVTHGHSGNWTTIGCMGMLATLAVFPVLCDTTRYTDYCIRTFANEIDAQVRPDGVQDELTPHYHYCVLNNLLSAIRSLRALGRQLEPRTLQALRGIVHYCQQTVVPDGSKQVSFNDADPSAVPALSRLLPEVGLAEYLTPPARLGPEVFPYAGVAFLRQRQDQGDLYLAFDAGPFGRAHQHEDKLSFWLFAYGRNFIVDPGRHLYDHSAASYYDYLTGTRAHSTIMVDGQGQNSRAHPDTWIARKPIDLGWRVTDGEIRASGIYDLGYGAQPPIAMTHRREIVFLHERCWIIFDEAAGGGEHQLASRFQFAPGTLRLDGARAHTEYPDANLLLQAHATVPFMETRVECGQQQPRGGWYSDGYNKIEPAPALVLVTQSALPVRMATLLFPYRGIVAPDVTFTFDGQTATLTQAELGTVLVNSAFE